MKWNSKGFWIVVILLAITGIYTNILRCTRVAVKEQVDLKQFPKQIGEWQTEESYILDQKTLEILKSNQDVGRRYVNSRGQTIGFFIAYFNDQKYGAQIHSPKHCLPGGGWKIIHKETYTIQLQSSPLYQLKMNKLVTSNKRFQELMVYWFWTRGGTITSEYGLKIDLAKNALFRKPTDAAFVRINLPIMENNPSEALQLASQFIEDVFPAIKQVLPFEQ